MRICPICRTDEIILMEKQNMKTENRNSTQKISTGFNLPTCPMRYGYCCADCLYMSMSDRNRYGEHYCGRYGKYYDPASSVCSSFQDKRK